MRTIYGKSTIGFFDKTFNSVDKELKDKLTDISKKLKDFNKEIKVVITGAFEPVPIVFNEAKLKDEKTKQGRLTLFLSYESELRAKLNLKISKLNENKKLDIIELQGKNAALKVELDSIQPAFEQFETYRHVDVKEILHFDLSKPQEAKLKAHDATKELLSIALSEKYNELRDEYGNKKKELKDKYDDIKNKYYDLLQELNDRHSAEVNFNMAVNTNATAFLALSKKNQQSRSMQEQSEANRMRLAELGEWPYNKINGKIVPHPPPETKTYPGAFSRNGGGGAKTQKKYKKRRGTRKA
jgi:hypothetical protein